MWTTTDDRPSLTYKLTSQAFGSAEFKNALDRNKVHAITTKDD